MPKGFMQEFVRSRFFNQRISQTTNHIYILGVGSEPGALNLLLRSLPMV